MRHTGYAKFALVALVFAFIFAFTPMDANAAERRTIRVGLEAAYAPYNWQESEATEINVPIENLAGFYAEGYDVQIARIIADRLNANLAVLKISWSGLIEALNSGQIDMIIAGMADTAERREAINFSDPYHATEYGVMLHKDSKYANATDIQDLAGASLLGQRDTKLDTVIDQIQGVNHLTPVDSVPNQIARLTQGTCDAIVINIENAPGYLAAYPNFTAIRFAQGKGFDLGFTGSCVGLRKSDTGLLAEVNAALATIPEEQRIEMFNAAIERQPK